MTDDQQYNDLLRLRDVAREAIEKAADDHKRYMVQHGHRRYALQRRGPAPAVIEVDTNVLLAAREGPNNQPWMDENDGALAQWNLRFINESCDLLQRSVPAQLIVDLADWHERWRESVSGKGIKISDVCKDIFDEIGFVEYSGPRAVASPVPCAKCGKQPTQNDYGDYQCACCFGLLQYWSTIKEWNEKQRAENEQTDTLSAVGESLPCAKCGKLPTQDDDGDYRCLKCYLGRLDYWEIVEGWNKKQRAESEQTDDEATPKGMDRVNL